MFLVILPAENPYKDAVIHGLFLLKTTKCNFALANVLTSTDIESCRIKECSQSNQAL